MIYDLIIFGGGIITGYFLTKTGYADQFIEKMQEKITENKKRTEKTSFWGK